MKTPKQTIPLSSAAEKAAKIIAAAKSQAVKHTPSTTTAFGDPVKAGAIYKPHHFTHEAAPADGNCFYSSVGAALHGTSTSDTASMGAMRQELLHYINDNEDDLISFAVNNGVNIEDIKHLVETQGQWSGDAGDLVPPLMAQATGREILVFQENSGKDEYSLLGILPPYVDAIPGKDRTQKGEPAICLVKSNIGASGNITHYDLLKPGPSLLPHEATPPSSSNASTPMLNEQVLTELRGFRKAHKEPEKNIQNNTFSPINSLTSSDSTRQAEADTDAASKPASNSSSHTAASTDTNSLSDSNSTRYAAADTDAASTFTYPSISADSNGTLHASADTDAGSRFDSISSFDSNTTLASEYSTDSNTTVTSASSLHSITKVDSTIKDKSKKQEPDKEVHIPSSHINQLKTMSVKPTSRPIQSKDDHDLAKNPSIDCLQKADIDTSHFTSSFLASDGLLKALKKKNYLVTKDTLSNEDKKDIKNIVNELSEKHVRRLPLEQGINLQDNNDLSLVLNKLSQKLAGMASMDQCVALNRSLDNINSSTSKNEVITTLSDIAKDIKKFKHNEKSQLMSKTINMITDELSISILKESKKELKEEIMKNLNNLNKPGSEVFTRGSLTINIPASPAVSISLGFEQLQRYRTEDYLTILEHKENTGILSANIGLSDDLSVSIGNRTTVNNMRTHRNLEQLADDHADSLLSMAIKFPLKSAKDTKKLRKLNNLVKQHNNIQNKNDRLNTNLQTLGILDDKENLKSPAGHRKKMPQTRKRYSTELNAQATVNLPINLLNASAGGTIRKQVTNEYDRKPIISSLLSNSQYLDQKIKDVHSKILDTIDEHDAQNSVDKNPASETRGKAIRLAVEKREEIKEKIIENLDLYKEYSKHVRSSDDYAVTHKQSKSEKKLRAIFNPTSLNEGAKGKKRIEKELNVKGRSNTFEKLIVQHAALTKKYNETFNDKLSAPIAGSEEARQAIQFSSALKSINKQLESSSVTLNNNDLDTLHSLTKTRVDKLEARGNTTFSVMGANIMLEGIRSKTDHADPLKTGQDTNFSMIITGNINQDIVGGIVLNASERMTSSDASSDEATAEEVQNELEKAITWAINAGVTAGMQLDISIRDSAVKFTRVSTTSQATTGATIGQSVGLGGQATLATGQNTVLKDWMGTNSLYYPHYQFNGLASAGTVDSSGSREDSWSQLASEHRGEITSIVKKISDPTSKPSQYLDALIEGNESTYGEENLKAITGAIERLRKDSNLMLKAEESNDEKSAESSFKDAVDDLRDIFSIYGKTVYSKAKNEKKVLIINK